MKKQLSKKGNFKEIKQDEEHTSSSSQGNNIFL
jgi:hypothetical protein